MRCRANTEKRRIAIRRWRVFGIGITRLKILILIALAIFYISSHSHLDQTRARLRAGGLPVTPADLHLNYPPDSENAALIYAQLTQLLATRPLTGQDTILNDTGEIFPSSPARLVQIRLALHNRQDVVQLAHRITALPQCGFKRDYSRGFYLSLSEGDSARTAMRILMKESDLLLADGKPLEAVREQVLGFQMARHFANQPDVPDQMKSAGLNAMTLTGMRHTLYAFGDRGEVAEAVANAIAQNWQPANIARGIEGDIVLTGATCEMLRKNAGEFDKEEQKRHDLISTTWLLMDANEHTLLDWEHRIYLSISRPYPESRAAMLAIQKEVTAKSKNPFYAFSSVMYSVYDQLPEAQARARAREVETRVGAQVLAYRARHGAFPSRLDQLRMPVPLDPFSGQPMGYRLESGSKGFVVYSVGPTGNFDGGTPEEDSDHNRETLFRYPLPAHSHP